MSMLDFDGAVKEFLGLLDKKTPFSKNVYLLSSICYKKINNLNFKSRNRADMR